jgi:hypothetical protein
MGPVCKATAAPIAGKVTFASGAAAMAIRRLGGKNAVVKIPAYNLSKLSGRENAAGEIAPHSNQRRDQYAIDRDCER